MTLLAFPLGFFYVIAGLFVLRTIYVGTLLDRAIDAIKLSKPDPKEQMKTFILTAGAYLTAASGASLVTLSSLATILFALNVGVQGGYLLWASKALPPEDEADRKGRRQTTNAFVIYSAVTAFILWLEYTGGLRPWPRDVQSLLIELIAPAAAALACYLLVYQPGMRTKASGFGFGSGGSFGDPGSGTGDEAIGAVTGGERTQSSPVNLRLRPEFSCWPLWDADTGENVSHYHVDISFDLAERIEIWDDRFQAVYRDEDPASSAFPSPEEEQSYVEEGRAIARELTEVWPGNVEIDDRFR